jgi:hypothetical protein
MPRKKQTKTAPQNRLIPIRLSAEHIELLDRLCKRELDNANRTDMIRRLIDRAAVRLPAPARSNVDPFAVAS